MKEKFSELIIINSFFLFTSILLLFLNYEYLAGILLVLILLLNIINYFLNSIKIRYSLIRSKKAIIYAIIDNQNIMNLYYESKKANEITKMVYKELKHNVKKGTIVKKYRDHFLIITTTTGKVELTNKITKLNEKIGLILKDELFTLSLRYGIHICDDDDFNSNENRANIACNNAKKEHMSYYSFYDNEDIETMIKEKKILANLVKSLKSNEFEVYFQPKYDFKDKKIVGSEALARLISDGHVVAAKDFIDIAEKYGFTTYLDKYVLKEVCKKIVELKKKKIDFGAISVNISRNTLCEKEIMKYYESTLEKYGIRKSEIEFEVTERDEIGTTLSNNIVHELCKKFNVSVDDFGVGNSSLSMLIGNKIKTVKIDRQFIIDDSESGRKLLNNIIKLIKELNYEMVAEGVDTKEQLDYLKSRGCNVIQGYYFYKPLPFEEYEKVLEGEVSGS